MKSKILIFFIALVSALSASAAVTADQVMQKASATLTSPASVTVSFGVINGGNSGSGVAVMSNRRFYLTLGAMTVWYNGKTQWTANSNTREVSITTPLEEEIFETNPFVVLSQYKKITPASSPSRKQESTPSPSRLKQKYHAEIGNSHRFGQRLAPYKTHRRYSLRRKVCPFDKLDKRRRQTPRLAFYLQRLRIQGLRSHRPPISQF